VERIAINVMDDLFAVKCSSFALFDNEAMLRNPLTIDRDEAVALILPASTDFES
jgi:hypothetical protein